MASRTKLHNVSPHDPCASNDSISMQIGPFPDWEKPVTVDVHDTCLSCPDGDPDMLLHVHDVPKKSFTLEPGETATHTFQLKTKGHHLITLFLWDADQVKSAEAAADKQKCTFQTKVFSILVC